MRRTRLYLGGSIIPKSGIELNKVSIHKLYLTVWGITLLVLFVVLPFGLMAVGFSRVVSLSFVLGVAGLLSDGFLTKAGLTLGCSETNVFYTFLKGTLTVNHKIVLSRVGGIILLAFVMILFRDAVLLLIFSMTSIVCVIANSITLTLKVLTRTNSQ